jgi:hypothetical protein
MITRFNFGRKGRCHSGPVEIVEGTELPPFRSERERMGRRRKAELKVWKIG